MGSKMKAKLLTLSLIFTVLISCSDSVAPDKDKLTYLIYFQEQNDTTRNIQLDTFAAGSSISTILESNRTLLNKRIRVSIYNPDDNLILVNDIQVLNDEFKSVSRGIRTSNDYGVYKAEVVVTDSKSDTLRRNFYLIEN